MDTNVSDKRANEKSAPSAPMLVLRIVVYALIMGALWYFVSGRWDWWMGWAVLAADVALAIVALVVVPLDQELADERTQLKEGVKTWDKWLVISTSFWMPLGMLIVAALDVRFEWSLITLIPLQVAALVIAVLGRLWSTWAAAANKFYGRFVRIQKERGHTTISAGPYRFMRHPGYAGIIVYFICVAVAFGSRWTLLGNVLASLILVIRTALEDKTLLEELEGYREYAQQTRFRLIPGIW